MNINRIISSPIITNPWNHKVVDNLFTEESFNIINEAANHLLHLSVHDKTVPIHIDEAISLGISKQAGDLILDTADQILQNLVEIVGPYSLNKLLHGGYFIMPKFGITGRNFQYPIHDESIFKVLNIVTYLQPTVSVGTRLYSSPSADSLVKQVEWKPNRAAVFFPGHGVTWHNWTGQPTDEPRITLNFFVERIEVLRNSLYKPGEQEDALNSLLWFYEKIGQGRLHVEI